MKRVYRCGPLMHRVDEDQRIDGIQGFQARGAKMLFWYCFARAGGPLIDAGGGLIGKPLPRRASVRGRKQALDVENSAVLPQLWGVHWVEDRIKERF